MRKLMLLAAMLAMVLAAALPALAQEADGDQYVFSAECQNILGVLEAGNSQYGSEEEVAQELNVSVEQVNACQAAASATPDAASAQYASPTATATATATASPTASALPDTGGITPLSGAIALGAGALLVGGGLLARRLTA